MRSHTHMLQMQIRRDEHGTHKHAHGSWNLCSVSRVCSKTMHSLFRITSWLSYITLCYIIPDFFYPGTIALGSIRLPSRSLAFSRDCLLAITTKPLLSGPPIKRLLGRVPKLRSYISLYNEPLFSGHLY